MKQSFDAVAGTVLTVDWNLVTLDGTFDGAILALSSTDGVGYFTASLLKGFGDITGSTLCSHASFASGPTFCDAFGQGTESGWRSSSFVIPFSGTFTFAAAVGEGPDGWVPTALALDNIRVQQVSEPATLVLALLGLGVLPIWRRYNRLCH